MLLKEQILSFKSRLHVEEYIIQASSTQEFMQVNLKLFLKKKLGHLSEWGGGVLLGLICYIIDKICMLDSYYFTSASVYICTKNLPPILGPSCSKHH